MKHVVIRSSLCAEINAILSLGNVYKSYYNIHTTLTDLTSKIYFTQLSADEKKTFSADYSEVTLNTENYIRWTAKVLGANPVRVFMSGDLGGKQSHAFPQKTIKMN